MLYVGVDAHKSTSQITVMNEAGVILGRKRVHSTSEGFKEALAGYDEPFKAVLEESYSWGPMYDWLDDMSEEGFACSSVEGSSDRFGTDQERPHRFRSARSPAPCKPHPGCACAVARDSCSSACPPTTDVLRPVTDHAAEPYTRTAGSTFH